MATQLSLYNGALRLLKERPLVALTDPVKSRRELDNVWKDQAIRTCLEEGYWNFAVRTAKFTPKDSFTATFGYKNQFIIPADFVRLVSLCLDEYFNVPNNMYTEEAGSWYSDEHILYVSYVSDDDNYGRDLTRWPESFSRYVEHFLADRVSGLLTGELFDQDLLRRVLVKARSKDAMNEPTKFLPQGRFTRSRQGSRSHFDRGNRNRLIGS